MFFHHTPKKLTQHFHQKIRFETLFETDSFKKEILSSLKIKGIKKFHMYDEKFAPDFLEVFFIYIEHHDIKDLIVFTSEEFEESFGFNTLLDDYYYSCYGRSDVPKIITEACISAFSTYKVRIHKINHSYSIALHLSRWLPSLFFSSFFLDKKTNFLYKKSS